MDLQTFEHEDTCYVSIQEFGEAIMTKDYKTALDRYTELGYEIAFLKGKSSEAIESILKTMLLIEMEIVEALGEYIKAEEEGAKPGDSRLVHFSNILIQKTVELLHKHYPIYSHMLDEEMFAGLGLKVTAVKGHNAYMC